MFEQEFLDFASEHGFSIRSVVSGSRYIRFDHNKKKNAGYYNLDSDGNGVVGCWATDEQYLFRPGDSRKMTAQERIEV